MDGSDAMIVENNNAAQYYNFVGNDEEKESCISELRRRQMKVTMSIGVYCKRSKKLNCSLQKQIDTEASFVPGMLVEDLGWNVPHRIESVIFMAYDDALFLTIRSEDSEHCESKKSYQERLAMLRKWDWK